MSYETVIWEQEGAVGTITLNRPASLNAWTEQFGLELGQVLAAEALDESVRAVLITGAGRGFSSGADLKAGFHNAPDGRPDIFTELQDVYHPVITGIRQLPKPVVAAINGPAVGIGLSLALACDLQLAAESAFLSLAFVNIGLMPDGGSTAFVAPAVGRARAFQLALLGERVTRGPGPGVGSGQLGVSRRAPARGGPCAHPAPGPGPDALLRLEQAGAQPLDLRRPRRAAAARGRTAARPRSHPGLRRGRDGLR